MNKTDLHLKYRNETGKDRPEVTTEEPLVSMNKDCEIIEVEQSQEIINYVEWLEEAVDSVLSVNEKLLDQLRTKPKKITIKE